MSDGQDVTKGTDFISIAVFVTLVFVLLKLLELITFSWWWVFSPVLIIGGFISIVFVIFLFIELRKEYNKR